MKILKISLLAMGLIYSLNLSAKNVVPDTLKVVMEDQFLRYPFGSFQSLKSFKDTNKTLLSSKTPDVKPYENGTKEETKMFMVNKSYVRFYRNRDTKKLETVNSIILSEEIQLQNHIMIGMDQADFLKKLNITNEGAANASVIASTSKTHNIHHYYNFQNGKLVRIMIFSQFFYQKQ